MESDHQIRSDQIRSLLTLDLSDHASLVNVHIHFQELNLEGPRCFHIDPLAGVGVGEGGLGGTSEALHVLLIALFHVHWCF